MKIYTKTGDSGETGLFGGGRVPKDHPRIAAYGALDELNAALGVARAESERGGWSEPDFAEGLSEVLRGAQDQLFELGAELATPEAESRGMHRLTESGVERLERAIDAHEAALPPLREFILPGGSATAAALHLARCVCRRAERELVTLAASETVRELPVRYVNRLSDLLFVLARAANRAAGVGDTPWRKGAD